MLNINHCLVDQVRFAIRICHYNKMVVTGSHDP